jgi:hypothetical protein
MFNNLYDIIFLQLPSIDILSIQYFAHRSEFFYVRLWYNYCITSREVTTVWQGMKSKSTL